EQGEIGSALAEPLDRIEHLQRRGSIDRPRRLDAVEIEERRQCLGGVGIVFDEQQFPDKVWHVDRRIEMWWALRKGWLIHPTPQPDRVIAKSESLHANSLAGAALLDPFLGTVIENFVATTFTRWP